MDKQDQILLLLGEVHGSVKNIDKRLDRFENRIRSLETSRTKFLAVFGLVSASFWGCVEWVKGFSK